MAKNFKALQAKMPPEARRRAEAKAEAMLRSMSLTSSAKRWISLRRSSPIASR